MSAITPPSHVTLSDEEQEHLFALIHQGVNSARVITRARILSKLARGQSNQDICRALEVTLPTVLKIRKRFTDGGLEAALAELPRPGAKPKLDAKQAAIESRPSLAQKLLMDTTTGRCVCWARKSWNSGLPRPTALKACASF
jgi:hypothetical protein